MGKKKKRAEREAESELLNTETISEQNDLHIANGDSKKIKKKKTKEVKEESVLKEKPTVSIALAGSIIDNAQSLELATRLAGQIARASTIFRIDEVVVFDNIGSSVDCSDPTMEDGSHDDESGAAFLFRILKYMETPQYLRKSLFPMHNNLRYVGSLPPLDAPHHLRKHEWAPYREGVTLKDRDLTSGGTLVDVGLSKPVAVDEVIAPGIRVTVSMGAERNLDAGIPHQVVSSSTPMEDARMYWGYKVRYAPNISSVFKNCPYKGGYDHLIGTSEHGLVMKSSDLTLPSFRHLLIAFGGLAGLEECIEEDNNLKGKSAKEVFDLYLNTCPHQGSRTIRTENFGILGNGRVHILQLSPNGPISKLIAFDTTDGVYDVCWSEAHDSLAIVASSDGSVKLYDIFLPPINNPILDRNISVRTFKENAYCVYSASWNPRHADIFSSTSGDCTTRIWDVPEPGSTMILPAHKFEILTCDWNKYDDCIIATTSVDKSIKIWDIRNYRVPIAVLNGHGYAVRKVRFSPHRASAMASCSYDMTVACGITWWKMHLLRVCLSWRTVHIASTVQLVAVDQVIDPGIRVTVSMGAEKNLDAGEKCEGLKEVFDLYLKTCSHQGAGQFKQRKPSSFLCNTYMSQSTVFCRRFSTLEVTNHLKNPGYMISLLYDLLYAHILKIFQSEDITSCCSWWWLLLVWGT
ncbi:hypothetical protein RDI58_001653 [Solanum bulbocastanum]|uniref:Uncharacterized protein n=1 Tax=Solanum bulbocastanum TaxID=147425 RepID=A0AAN8U5H3_SOLBU